MMDLFLIIFTGFILRLPATGLRVILAASLGSFCTCISVWFHKWIIFLKMNEKFFMIRVGYTLLYVFFFYGILTLTMFYIAFGLMPKKKMFHCISVFFAITLFTGGVMESIKNIIFTFHHLNNIKINGMLILWFVIISSILISTFFLLRLLRALYQKQKIERTVCTIRLEHKNCSVQLKMLLDTGNNLFEPKTGKPVSIVESHILKQLLSSDIHPKMCRIFYCSLGNSKGELETFWVDKMLIVKDKNVWNYENVLIGSYEGVLDKKGGYHGILHPSLIL